MSTSPTTVVCSTDTLSRIADRVLKSLPEDIRPKKNAVLNMIAAEVAGSRHNWGYLINATDPVFDPRLPRGITPTLGTPTDRGTPVSQMPLVSPIETMLDDADGFTIDLARDADPANGYILGLRDIYSATLRNRLEIPLSHDDIFRISATALSMRWARRDGRKKPDQSFEFEAIRITLSATRNAVSFQGIEYPYEDFTDHSFDLFDFIDFLDPHLTPDLAAGGHEGVRKASVIDEATGLTLSLQGDPTDTGPEAYRLDVRCEKDDFLTSHCDVSFDREAFLDLRRAVERAHFAPPVSKQPADVITIQNLEITIGHAMTGFRGIDSAYQESFPDIHTEKLRDLFAENFRAIHASGVLAR